MEEKEDHMKGIPEDEKRLLRMIARLYVKTVIKEVDDRKIITKKETSNKKKLNSDI